MSLSKSPWCSSLSLAHQGEERPFPKTSFTTKDRTPAAPPQPHPSATHGTPTAVKDTAAVTSPQPFTVTPRPLWMDGWEPLVASRFRGSSRQHRQRTTGTWQAYWAACRSCPCGQPASPLALPSHSPVCIVSHTLIIHEKASQSIPSMIPPLIVAMATLGCSQPPTVTMATEKPKSIQDLWVKLVWKDNTRCSGSKQKPIHSLTSEEGAGGTGSVFGGIHTHLLYFKSKTGTEHGTSRNSHKGECGGQA